MSNSTTITEPANATDESTTYGPTTATSRSTSGPVVVTTKTPHIPSSTTTTTGGVHTTTPASTTTQASGTTDCLILPLALGLGIPLLLFMVATLVLSVLLYRSLRKPQGIKRKSEIHKRNTYVQSSETAVDESPVQSQTTTNSNETRVNDDNPDTNYLPMDQGTPRSDNPSREYDFYEVQPVDSNNVAVRVSDGIIYQNFDGPEDEEMYVNYGSQQDSTEAGNSTAAEGNVELPTRKQPTQNRSQFTPAHSLHTPSAQIPKNPTYVNLQNMVHQ